MKAEHGHRTTRSLFTYVVDAVKNWNGKSRSRLSAGHGLSSGGNVVGDAGAGDGGESLNISSGNFAPGIAAVLRSMIPCLQAVLWHRPGVEPKLPAAMTEADFYSNAVI